MMSMRIGGEAPGGGAICRSASSAMFEYGIPPPRIVNSAVVLKSQRERRMVPSRIPVSVAPFGRWTSTTLQWFASSHKARERNDQFASEGDDHGLARATLAVGGAARYTIRYEVTSTKTVAAERNEWFADSPPGGIDRPPGPARRTFSIPLGWGDIFPLNETDCPTASWRENWVA